MFNLGCFGAANGLAEYRATSGLIRYIQKIEFG